MRTLPVLLMLVRRQVVRTGTLPQLVLYPLLSRSTLPLLALHLLSKQQGVYQVASYEMSEDALPHPSAPDRSCIGAITAGLGTF